MTIELLSSYKGWQIAKQLLAEIGQYKVFATKNDSSQRVVMYNDSWRTALCDIRAYIDGQEQLTECCVRVNNQDDLPTVYRGYKLCYSSREKCYYAIADDHKDDTVLVGYGVDFVQALHRVKSKIDRVLRIHEEALGKKLHSIQYRCWTIEHWVNPHCHVLHAKHTFDTWEVLGEIKMTSIHFAPAIAEMFAKIDTAMDKGRQHDS